MLDLLPLLFLIAFVVVLIAVVFGGFGLASLIISTVPKRTESFRNSSCPQCSGDRATTNGVRATCDACRLVSPRTAVIVLLVLLAAIVTLTAGFSGQYHSTNDLAGALVASGPTCLLVCVIHSCVERVPAIKYWWFAVVLGLIACLNASALGRAMADYPARNPPPSGTSDGLSNFFNGINHLGDGLAEVLHVALLACVVPACVAAIAAIALKFVARSSTPRSA